MVGLRGGDDAPASRLGESVDMDNERSSERAKIPKREKKGEMNGENASGPNLVPNSTVVLKNLPFDLDPVVIDHALESLSLEKSCRRIHFHSDPQTKKFLGIAFLKFNNVADAVKAFDAFQTAEFDGRKVRVEYKYSKREEEDTDRMADSRVFDKRADFFTKRSIQKEKESSLALVREKYGKIVADFVEDPEKDSIVLTENLPARSRYIIHEIAKSHGIGHKSLEDENGNRHLHLSKDPETIALWNQEEAAKAEAAGESRAENAEKKKKPVAKTDIEGIKWFTPRSQRKQGEGEQYAGGSISKDGLLAAVQEAGGAFTPQVQARRQPKGPQGPGFIRRIAAHAAAKSASGSVDFKSLSDAVYMAEAETPIEIE